MKIRFYNKDDYNSLKSLYEKTKLYANPNDSEKIINEQIDHDKESIIVIEENNTIIGSIIVVFVPWNSFVFHLAVLPEYQNKGIGGKLLSKAENQLIKKGAKRISLFVHIKEKELVNYYKKRGWKIYDTLVNLLKDT